MKRNNKLLIFSFIVILIASVTTFTYASEDSQVTVSGVEYTDEYKQWLNLSDEEKNKILMPRAYNVDYSATTNITSPILRMRVVMASNQAKYSLQNVIPENLKIKDQKSTGACWAFAAISSLETNLAMQDKKAGVNPAKVYDYSERHMEYATSKTFLNGKINSNGFNREVDSGGNFLMAQAYLTNGQGAIKEAEMPFEDNANKIDISEIQNKTVATQVYDTAYFTNYMSLTSDKEKEEVMNKIKQHIQTYGSVFATIHAGTEAAPADNCYNEKTGAKFCGTSFSTETHPLDHGVSIVGWDDNYSIDNFNSKNRPTKNGAWIIRNSWGTGSGDNGYIYVSYQDYNIATNLCGIQKSDDSVNYNKIYQYDMYSGSTQDTINVRSGEKLDVMLYNVFDRNSSDTEYLTGVSIEAPEKYTCKVYINPNGSDVSASSMQQIELKSGETQTIDPGYHTLEFAKPVQLKGSQFIVMVQIESERNKVAVENDKVDEKYSNVKIEKGKCFYTCANDVASAHWSDFSELDSKLRGDSTIKAFTVNELDDGSLKNIEVSKQPTKTTYFEGDNFDTTGLEITANYNSKKTPSEVLDKSKYTITNGTNLKKDQKSITVKYEDKTVEIPIDVKENSITELKIKTPPTKTSYMEGQSFDNTGMVVEATYANGSTKEIKDYEIQKGNNLVADQKEIVISYAGKTVSQAISVKVNELIELKITTKPTKTTYYIGDNFDKAGMKIDGIYEDGETNEIKDYVIEDGENLKENQKSITISYNGKNVTQEITVKENAITGIIISKAPNKTTYIVGEDFDKTGMIIEAEYEDGSKVEITNYEVENGNNLQLGQTSVTIIYGSMKAEQKISVDEEAKAQNSEFNNLEAVVKRLDISGNIELNPDDSDVKMIMDVDIKGINRNLDNDKVEYYYYLSTEKNEKNITDWVKVNDEQTENDKITINNIDIMRFKNIESSDKLYIYLKEVATKGSNQSEYETDGIELKLEEYNNDNSNNDNNNNNNSNNNNSNNNTNSNRNINNNNNNRTRENINLTDNSSKSSINGNKNNITNGIIKKLPYAGTKYGILITVVIISGIAIFAYIRYKTLSKYTK